MEKVVGVREQSLRKNKTQNHTENKTLTPFNKQASAFRDKLEGE